MKLGSLFDGSGGFPLAGALCGIEPCWASEVEPYPIAVTRSRFPKMKHLGDINKINGAEIEPVDIITFGSPCQDLSVAGKRAGLKHEVNGDDETTRSGLFMEAVRIIKEMREATNGTYPRFALWENVPGAFSSNKGEDFRIVLEELIKIAEPEATMPSVPGKGWAYADSYIGDGWSLAYRVFDAQYWGVPQRRRRIHLIADFRGECARKILFERESVRGYFETGRTPWQATPGDAQDCPGADDRAGESAGDGRGLDAIKCIENSTGRNTIFITEGVSPTLVADPHNHACFIPCTYDADHAPGVVEAVGFDSYNLCETGDIGRTVCTPSGGLNEHIPCVYYPKVQGLDIYNLATTGGIAASLTTATGQGASNTGPSVLIPYTLKMRSGCEGGGKGALVQENKSATLATNNDQYLFQPVSDILLDDQGGQQITVRIDGKSPTLRAETHGNLPCIMEPIGFDTYNQPHADDVVRIDDITAPLQARDYKGGKSVVYAIDQQGGKGGANYAENVMPTLCSDSHGTPHGVVYAVDQGGGKSGANVTENLSPTLTCTHGGEPVICLQGNGIDRADTAGCNGKGWKEGTCYTLNTIDRPAVVYNGENITSLHYIVRRLTPTECARLQGFADKWGHPDIKEDFTEEEYQFWLEVRNTHAAINGKQVKKYTVKQMLTWYNKLHTDSAEYKMWGNGIALPPALYCMQGIVEACL